MTNAFIVSRILNLFQKSRERKGSKRFASRILGVSVLTMIVLVAGCANTPAPSAPVITTNPTSLTVTAGATATFTAAASGTPTRARGRSSASFCIPLPGVRGTQGTGFGDAH